MRSEACVARGELKVVPGEAVSSLQSLSTQHQKFDLIINHELAAMPDRIAVISAMQALLKPGGRAYVSLRWWDPDGTYLHLNDQVIIGGRWVPLEDYLSSQFPEAFDQAYFPDAKTLIIKGTNTPVDLPPMSVRLGDGFVRGNYPNLVWTPERRNVAKSIRAMAGTRRIQTIKNALPALKRAKNGHPLIASNLICQRYAIEIVNT